MKPSTGKTPPIKVSQRQRQVSALVSLFQGQTALGSIERRGTLKPQHQRGARLMGVRAVRASLPASSIHSPALMPTTWWSEEDVVKQDVANVDAGDAGTGGGDDTGVRVLSEEVLPVTLLNGKAIEMTRRVLFNTRSRRRFKEYLARDDEGNVFPYNKILRDLIPLYRVADLALVGGEDSVTIVESTGPADALIERGIKAVGTITGAFVAPSVNALQPLTKAATIYLWPDNDAVGARHMDMTAARLRAMGHQDIRIILWQGGPRKGDAADFTGGEEEFARLYCDARPWSEETRIPQTNVIRVRPPHPVTARLSLDDDLRPPMPRIAF